MTVAPLSGKGPKMPTDSVFNLVWIKSSRSIASGACVELAKVGQFIAIRDSKNPDVAPHYYSHAEMAAFLEGVKRGEFDHLLM